MEVMERAAEEAHVHKGEKFKISESIEKLLIIADTIQNSTIGNLQREEELKNILGYLIRNVGRNREEVHWFCREYASKHTQ
jgi:hypothetical protein